MVNAKKKSVFLKGGNKLGIKGINYKTSKLVEVKRHNNDSHKRHN